MAAHINYIIVVLVIIASSLTDAKNCNPSPCGSGSCTMKRYGKKMREFCRCRNGYTGKSCRWPCVDVYKSCQELWKEENRCRVHGQWTNWYDVNCPVTCNVCRVDQRTVPKGIPYPPMLEPIEQILGIYRLESYNHKKWPVWFSAGSRYEEEIKFELAQVPMFGTPCLNYSSIAKNKDYPGDVQTENGFISVVDRWKRYPVGIGLMRVTNNGAVFWEEGKAMNDRSTIEWELKGVETLDGRNDGVSMKHKFPEKAKRKVKIGRNYMDVQVEEVRNGREERYSMRYSKTQI